MNIKVGGRKFKAYCPFFTAKAEMQDIKRYSQFYLLSCQRFMKKK